MESQKARRLCIGVGVLLLLAAGRNVDAASRPAGAPAEQEGLSLRIAVSDALPQLDPFLQNTAASNWILHGNVFEGLIRFADGEAAPSLATSWVQEDDLTWVFTLRPGVTFHDGRPLTVADVVASVRRALDHPRAAIAARVAQIETAEARDAEHLAVRLRSPSRSFLRGIAMVPIVADASSEAPLDPLIATGPFRVAGYSKAEHLVVERYAGYWGDRPEVARAEFLFEPDEEARARMLINGEVELANQLHPSSIPAIEAHRELWVESSLGTNVRILVFDVSTAPYSDPRVREAVDLALDRDELVDVRYDGYARVAYQLADPGSSGHLPELAQRGRNLERARELVVAASGDGEIVLRMHCGSPAPAETDAMERQLEAAGFQVEVVPIEWQVLYPQMQNGEIPFVYQGWSNYSGDVASTFEEMVHSYSPDGQLGKANHGRYANPEVDRLIKAAMVTEEADQRQETYERISRMLASERPIVPLVRPLSIFGLRRDLAWTAPPTAALTLSEMTIRR